MPHTETVLQETAMRALLIAACSAASLVPAGLAAQSSAVQAEAGAADCDRLISVLEGKPPAQAFVTLEQARVYRKGAQYIACRDALARLPTTPEIEATGSTGGRTGSAGPKQ